MFSIFGRNGASRPACEPAAELLDNSTRKVGVSYWDWWDEGTHRVGAVERRQGETVHVEIEGALGTRSFELTLTGALALAAALLQVNIPTP